MNEQIGATNNYFHYWLICSWFPVININNDFHLVMPGPWAGISYICAFLALTGENIYQKRAYLRISRIIQLPFVVVFYGTVMCHTIKMIKYLYLGSCESWHNYAGDTLYTILQRLTWPSMYQSGCWELHRSLCLSLSLKIMCKAWKHSQMQLTRSRVRLTHLFAMTVSLHWELLCECVLNSLLAGFKSIYHFVNWTGN